MLFTSPTISTAHFYKEDFLKILDCKDRQSATTAFSDWINSALDCGIAQFVKDVYKRQPQERKELVRYSNSL